MTRTAVADDDYPDFDRPKVGGWWVRKEGEWKPESWTIPNHLPMDSDQWYIGIGDFPPPQKPSGASWTTTTTAVVVPSLPKPLDADSPEPPVGSVVWVANGNSGVAYQRFEKSSGPQYWHGTDGSSSSWQYLVRRGTATLLR